MVRKAKTFEPLTATPQHESGGFFGIRQQANLPIRFEIWEQ